MKKEVIFGGPKYKQNRTSFILFNRIILKIPFNGTNSQSKLNEKKGYLQNVISFFITSKENKMRLTKILNMYAVTS